MENNVVTFKKISVLILKIALVSISPGRYSVVTAMEVTLQIKGKEKRENPSANKRFARLTVIIEP